MWRPVISLSLTVYKSSQWPWQRLMHGLQDMEWKTTNFMTFWVKHCHIKVYGGLWGNLSLPRLRSPFPHCLPLRFFFSCCSASSFSPVSSFVQATTTCNIKTCSISSEDQTTGPKSKQYTQTKENRKQNKKHRNVSAENGVKVWQNLQNDVTMAE